MEIKMAFDVPAALLAKWREIGLVTDQTLGEAFLQTAREHPGARLVVASEVRPASVTLGEVLPAVRRLAGGLKSLGIRPGDIVAVQTPNWLETLQAHAAILLLGGVILPIVDIYGRAEVEYVLRQSGAKAWITADFWRGKDYAELGTILRPHLPDIAHIVIGHAPPGAIAWDELAASPPLEQFPAEHPNDVAMLMYTSGTTSAPKGVQHSHCSLMAELRSMQKPNMELSFLSPWPPGHVAGVLGLARYWAFGHPTVLMDRWDGGEAAKLVEQYRIGYSSGTPFHLSSLLDAAEAQGNDLSSLTDYMLGATMVPPSLVARCEARGLRTYRCYGLSEHPTVSSGSPSDPLDKRLNTDGRLCPGVEVLIINDAGDALPVGEEGEILSRGPDRFLGYADPALNQDVLLPGGWLRTGDIGRLDAEGFLSITDRKKDIIIRGGENIASREVEDILSTIPGIREAAVVGMPHPTLGERVCAFIVTAKDHDVSFDSISAFFRDSNVARQKTPEHVVFIEELPRNATGKVLKPALRTKLREDQT
jgi:acyl-CoA synthetase (AMP-forming)/AMP-acid ligase II